MTRVGNVAWLVVSAVLSGCGSGSGSGGSSEVSDETARALEGVYELTAFNQNDASCDTEGPSTLDAMSDRYFVLVGTDVLGQGVLMLASCASVEDGKAKAAAAKSRQSYIYEFGFVFSSEQSPEALGGFEAGTGTNENGTCTSREYSAHDLASQGDAVHVESRTTELANVKADQDGFCWAEPAKERDEAASRPCSRLTTLAGQRVSGL